jgi:hypothetical protein
MADGSVLAVRRVAHLVVVAGGADNNGPLKSVIALETARMEWVPLPPLQTARRDAAVGALGDGSILVAGGNDGSRTLRSVERFNPLSGSLICRLRSPQEEAPWRRRSANGLMRKHVVLQGAQACCWSDSSARWTSTEMAS